MPKNIVKAYEEIRQEILRSGSPDGITHDRMKEMVIRNLGVIRDNTIERHIYWLRSLGYIAKIQNWPTRRYVARKRGQRDIVDIGEAEEKPSTPGEEKHDGEATSETRGDG
jgi:hypothetical protein